MARIDLKNICVEFPVYNVNSRSFKKTFIRLATGGTVVKDANQHVMICGLKDITLSIEHGDRIGLIGHNGAGKSTMLRLLAGIYEPTHGLINIQGRVSPMLDLMQGMEHELTGYENIILRGTMLGYTRSKIQNQMSEIAELTGLGDYLAMPIRTYSAGMMVRLAFAISTSIQPEILLIDEIVGAGDAAFMETARQRMNSLLNQSSIVVIANHSDEVMKELCNKALLLEGGSVKYFGSIEKALEIYHS